MHMYWKKEKRMNTATILKFWPITDGSPNLPRLHQPIRPKFAPWPASHSLRENMTRLYRAARCSAQHISLIPPNLQSFLTLAHDE